MTLFGSQIQNRKILVSDQLSMQHLRIMAWSLLFDKSAQMMTVALLNSWMSITALQLTALLVLLRKTSSNLHLQGEGSFMIHYTSGSQPFLMHSSLCSFSNFSFLPHDTKLFFIPPLLHESAGIFDFPVYSFSPAFYLSRCSFEFVG